MKLLSWFKNGLLRRLNTGLTFHYVDTRGFLSKYKLHTPAEDLTKNRATRRDVIKFALIQQAAQCLLGYLTTVSEPFVPHDYGVALWAQKINYFGKVASEVMRYTGLDLRWIMNKSQGYGIGYTAAFTQNIWSSHISNFSQIAGEHTNEPTVNFSAWELMAARILYWVIVPLFQYISAMVLADTFQYFTHRAFHVNRWLYSKFMRVQSFHGLFPLCFLLEYVHSMHHKVYVPFAYGAFYNHPLETIPIDAIGFPICLSIAGLDNRQAAFFGAMWTTKTVVDHCGYDFPYNPCNIICPHSVLYHDLQ